LGIIQINFLIYFNSNYSVALQASAYFNFVIIKKYPMCMKHIFKYKTKNSIKKTELQKRNYYTDRDEYRLMDYFTKVQIKNKNRKGIINLNTIQCKVLAAGSSIMAGAAAIIVKNTISNMSSTFGFKIFNFTELSSSLVELFYLTGNSVLYLLFLIKYIQTI